MSVTPAPAHATTPGDQLLATPPPPLAAAVEEFLAEWSADVMTVADIATLLSCGEAKTLARLLYAAGHPDSARALLNEHIDDDDHMDGRCKFD